MPAKNRDLHGSAPDQSPAALLLIDVINHFDYPGGAKLLDADVRASSRLALATLTRRRAMRASPRRCR